VGRGSALDLYIEDEEILKFDFYGKGRGHYHVQMFSPAPCKHNFLLFPEQDAVDQVERATSELRENLYWYLERHPLKTVRNFRIEKAHLNQLLAEIKVILLEYQSRVFDNQMTTVESSAN
jgi:hypothetical protein